MLLFSPADSRWEISPRRVIRKDTSPAARSSVTTSDTEEGWGYGAAPKTKEEFLERFASLTETQLRNPDHMGLCYTQLYDVEQEKNGLYRYDRTPKFEAAEIARALRKKAAIEE